MFLMTFFVQKDHSVHLNRLVLETQNQIHGLAAYRELMNIHYYLLIITLLNSKKFYKLCKMYFGMISTNYDPILVDSWTY